jgi:hypothetical protein
MFTHPICASMDQLVSGCQMTMEALRQNGRSVSIMMEVTWETYWLAARNPGVPRLGSSSAPDREEEHSGISCSRRRGGWVVWLPQPRIERGNQSRPHRWNAWASDASVSFSIGGGEPWRITRLCMEAAVMGSWSAPDAVEVFVLEVVGCSWAWFGGFAYWVDLG